MLMHQEPATKGGAGQSERDAGADRDPSLSAPAYHSSLEMALTAALCFVVACGAAYIVVNTDSRFSAKVLAGVTGLCFFLAGIVEAVRALRQAGSASSRKK